MSGKLRRTAAAGLVLAATLSACQTSNDAAPSAPNAPVNVVTDPQAARLHGTLLDPPLPRPTQILRDTSGQPFSLANRPETELTVLFFGYTHCPDVCPTTMADLAVARSELPARLRNHVTVVFVTEDPKRDTPGSLRRWLDGFDPAFLGLAGGSQATKTMLDQLYLPPTRRLPNPEDPVQHPDDDHPQHHHGDYGVEHAGIVYAFGPGNRTVIYSGGITPDQYAADFTRLLDDTVPSSGP